MKLVNINDLIEIARQAGKIVMSIYQQPVLDVQTKSDHSALTQADLLSHQFICTELAQRYSDIPVISEESTQYHDAACRKNWETFFLVDPLDGTKEFVERNGEFTINIALIKQNRPIVGVIYAPALNVFYFAEQGSGAYKIDSQGQTRLAPRANTGNRLRVAVSRSHLCSQTRSYIETLNQAGRQIEVIAAGSALKFGLIAEGSADIYPRFSPTMEWDTAAGQILVEEVAKSVTIVNQDNLLSYNKIDLKNPGFIVS